MWAVLFFAAAVLGSSQAWLFSRQVCYTDLGCFDTQTIRSLARPIVLLPDKPDVIGTRFFLYTRENTDKSVEQEIDRKSVSTLSTSSFEASRPTKIIIHGVGMSAHEPWVQKMKSELLKNADMNVIAVDWRNGAKLPYTQAVANVRVVAAETAKLLELIAKENQAMSYSSVHIIGYSVGAHGASEVGTRVKGIGRISGLDPAEPYFEGGVEVTRLEKRDADFVDVIHSDGSAFFSSLGIGYKAAIGHVDFFPNGGGDQPGCGKSASSKASSIISGALTGGFDGVSTVFTCSHKMAVDYYIESINSKCPFTAYPCKSYDDFKASKCLKCVGNSCSTMGYHADKSSARGNFYLMTSQKGSQPFCSYHYSVSIKMGVMSGTGYGKVSITLVDSKNRTYGPVPMTDDEGYVESSKTMSRLVILPYSLGEVVSTKVTYIKSDCFTCGSYTDFLRLQHVEVDGGEDQTKTKFCGKNLSVAKGQFRELPADVTNSC